MILRFVALVTCMSSIGNFKKKNRFGCKKMSPGESVYMWVGKGV